MEAARSRTVDAAPADVWAVVGDARELPRWWPHVERVEGVREGGWTTVMRSPRGRVVRADWRLESEERGARRAWAQRIEGTPFEKVITERRVEARVEGAGGEGTKVTLSLRQRSRKLGRFGDVILMRPARRELDQALAALAAVLEGDAPGGGSPPGDSPPPDSPSGDSLRPDSPSGDSPPPDSPPHDS